MKVLITGGCGFIGSHLVEYHQGRVEEIRVLDSLRTGFARNLEGFAHTFIDGSITDAKALREAVEGVDCIFHMAALVSVPESVERPDECTRINIDGLRNVLEAATDAGVRKLVLASTAAIYGNNPKVPKFEEMEPEPRSPYAETKLGGEKLCEEFTRKGKVETAALRFFNAFGERQDPCGAYAAAVPIFIKKALRNEPIMIYGDGGQTRDFIYVKDIVCALVHAISTHGLTGVYNVGYGRQMGISKLAAKIIELCGSKSVIKYGPERAGDVRHSVACVDKFRATGWQPNYSMEQGLASTLEFYREEQAVTGC